MNKNRFEEEVTPYVNELIRLAFSYVKNKQIAEDIVQDVLLKAYQSYETFRYEAKYKTYLYKMTINRCHDYFKSHSYKKQLFTDKWNHYFRNEKSSEEIVVEKENRYLLSEEVMKLKPIYREVILLQYYKQFSIQEISYLLDVSENTVKTRLTRAKQNLKKQLEQGGMVDELRKIE